MANQEPTTDVACGEPAMTPELREALTLLRDRSDDGEFRTLVDEVLGGRCSLYDAAATAAFGEAVFGRVAREFSERFADMTDEEKQAIAAQAGTDSGEPCAEHHRHSSGEGAEHGEVGPCGSPCRTCTALCGLAGGHQEH